MASSSGTTAYVAARAPSAKSERPAQGPVTNRGPEQEGYGLNEGGVNE